MGRDDAFEAKIRELTAPLNQQYPRPWMTSLADPCDAKVFVVGRNQAKGFPASPAIPHARYLDGLFNRNGQSCRGLYDEVTRGQPSQTRRNLDRLRERLEEAGVTGILETNVVCYSTQMSAGLRSPMHSGGREQGERIFRFLLAQARPQVIIVHGSGASSALGRVLGARLASAPVAAGSSVVSVDVKTDLFAGTVFPIPSLAPPAWNRWSSWSAEYLAKLARTIAGQANTR